MAASVPNSSSVTLSARIGAVTAAMVATRGSVPSAGAPRASKRGPMKLQSRTTPRGVSSSQPSRRPKVAQAGGQDRHGQVPFGQHAQPAFRRVVAPVGVLRPHGEDAPQAMAGRRQPGHETANAVRGHVHRLAGKLAPGIGQHRLEILLAPVHPGRLEAAHRRRPRFADAAIVVGQHIEAVAVQVFGEARVIAAAHRGRGVDDDQARSAVPAAAVATARGAGGFRHAVRARGGWRQRKPPSAVASAVGIVMRCGWLMAFLNINRKTGMRTCRFIRY